MAPSDILAWDLKPRGALTDGTFSPSAGMQTLARGHATESQRSVAEHLGLWPKSRMRSPDGNLISEELKTRVAALAGWTFTHGVSRIRRDWTLRNFNEAIAFINAVAEAAEQEQHHPDLHLEGYRRVWIEIFTHSVGGLTESDFRLAARIDALGKEEKPTEPGGQEGG